MINQEVSQRLDHPTGDRLLAGPSEERSKSLDQTFKADPLTFDLPV